MKDSLENTIKGLRKIQEEEYYRLGDMADQSAENAVAWLEYLSVNQCPEIEEEDRSSVLKRCEAVWNSCYADRAPWDKLGEGVQQEWVRVFGAFEQSGKATQPKEEESTYESTRFPECTPPPRNRW